MGKAKTRAIMLPDQKNFSVMLPKYRGSPFAVYHGAKITIEDRMIIATVHVWNIRRAFLNGFTENLYSTIKHTSSYRIFYKWFVCILYVFEEFFGGSDCLPARTNSS